MTNWYNSGARDKETNSDYRTKTVLKIGIATNPALVTIYVTDAFGPNQGKTVTADKLEIGDKYTVTGPNPYTSRKWYATVEKLPNGKISVK